MVDNLVKVTHDNNGHFYRIKMDIAKEGSSLWDLTPYFKGRVGDNRFGLQVTWTYQGRLLDVTGMKPYISGNVGNYSFDDKKELQLADDAATVHYTGSPDDCQSGGRAVYYFPEQMFPRDGIFKGYIGVLDDRDSSSQPHISGVTVWFKVLPGIAQMGHACDVYISDLDKALQNFKETLRQHNIDYENQLNSNNANYKNQMETNSAEFQRQLQQVITDARNTYNSQVANSRDAMNALDAEVKANRAELGNINHQLEGTEQQIAIHDIVTIPEHQRDIKAISEAIDQRLANVKTAPVAVENAKTLQEQYPNGADGIFITADTGHKWLWLTGSWTDCGEYQAIGIGDELLAPIKQQQADHESRISKNTDLIEANITQIRKNKNNIDDVKSTGNLTSVYITDQAGNYITDTFGNQISGERWMIYVDKTLSQSDVAADAKTVGDAIKSLKSFDATKFGLPVLYLSGNITSLKDKSKALKNEVTYNFPVYNIKGTIKKIKVQGASSAGLPKKNYTLNFDQDFTAFTGYGKQSKYVIKANYTDYSQARNVVSAKLWGKIRQSESTSSDSLQDEAGNYITDQASNHILGETDPQISIGSNSGAVDGFPIVVYVNNNYWGLYTFNIPKDGWMAKMPSKEGYAILDANWAPQGALSQETNLMDQIELQFCGTKDYSWVKNSINKLIEALVKHYDEASQFDEATQGLFDINSAIDYYAYSILIGNTDGVFRNYLLQTFDGQKWYLAPYDLDITFGRSVNYLQYYAADSDTENLRADGITFENATDSKNGNRLFYQLWKFHKEDILKRTEELIDTAMSVSTVDKQFTDFEAKIPSSLFREEVVIWPGIVETTVNNIGQITRWYSDRIDWLKKKYFETKA